MSKRALQLCFLPLLVITLVLGSCTEENPRPENLIPEDKYIDLLVELQMLEAYRSSFHPDSINIDSLTAIVFEEYGVSREQFASSHKYYHMQPTLQKKRVSQAMDTLRQQMIREGMIDSTEAEKLKRK